MKDFIDKTDTEAGTPINRANLMAMQGFIGSTISFMPDGSIVELNSNGESITTAFSDNAVTETFRGQKIITKTTELVNNGARVTIS